MAVDLDKMADDYCSGPPVTLEVADIRRFARVVAEAVLDEACIRVGRSEELSAEAKAEVAIILAGVRTL